MFLLSNLSKLKKVAQLIMFQETLVAKKDLVLSIKNYWKMELARPVQILRFKTHKMPKAA